jgi:poly(3-hydroxybutyrate) depolymerase
MLNSLADSMRVLASLSLLASTTLGPLTTAFAGQAAQHPRPGDFKDDYKDPASDDLVMRYRMVAPAKLPEKRTLGLIVAFHGLNGNEDSMTSFAIDAARRVQIADDYVVMGGKSKGDGWATSDDKDVLAWITWVIETYPIDRRRVHIIGMSNGGGMVKRFGWAHQDLFASISSYCGVHADFTGAPKGQKAPPPKGPASPAETRTEWYFVHGDADTTVAADATRLAMKQLTVKGYRCVYREIDGADHVGILRYSDVTDDNFRFIHALRSKNLQLSKEERTELTALGNKLKNEKAETAVPLVAEAMRWGGAAAAVALKSALRNADVEVKKAAIKATETVLFSREIAVELVKLTKDKSRDVKAAAFESLGTLANWRYAEVQQYLCQAARKSSLAVEDRVAAIRSLGKAVKLMLHGWYEDKDVVWSLVLLLDDKEAEVRKAAFEALKGGVKDTFQYSPDMTTAERKASVAKWKAWCEEKVR